MLRVIIKSFRSRFGRVLLSALSVVFGVAFISGVQIISERITNSATTIISQALAGTDVVVRSTTAQQSAGTLVRQTVPASILTDLQKQPGIRAADGIVQGFGRLIGDNDEPLDPGLVPTLIFNWIDDPVLSTGKVLEGSPPTKNDEILVDRRTAREQGWKIGHEVRLQAASGVKAFRLAGIGGIGQADNLAGARLVMLTTATAQAITGSEAQYSYILLSGETDSTESEVAATARPVLYPGIEAVPGTLFVAETNQQASSSLSLLAKSVQSFGLIGLVVAGLMIANTFTILVSQRTRELALLRACGASSLQIRVSVLIEGLAIGLAGGVAGFGLGVAGAWGAQKALSGVLSLPRFLPSLTWSDALLPIGLGVATSTIATMVPAWRATRIAPVAVMAEAAVAPAHVGRTRVVVGWPLVGIGVIATGWATIGLPPHRPTMYAVGSVLLMVGAALVGPAVAPLVVRIIGAPLRLLGPTGRLAVANAARHPKRTTATAVALALGIAVTAIVALVASSVTDSVVVTFQRHVRADIVIDAGLANPLAGGIPEVAGREIAKLPDVENMTRLRFLPAQVRSINSATSTSDQLVAGIDVPSFFDLVDVDVLTGSIRELDEQAVAVSLDAARRNGWSVGDAIIVSFPQVGDRQYQVKVVYRSPVPGASVLLSMAATDLVSTAAFRQDNQIFVKAKPGVSVDRLNDDVNAVLDTTAPSANAHLRKVWIANTLHTIGTGTNVIYVLLLFAIALSLFGVVNTLSLSVYERAAELSVLRAVGATRGQIRREVLAEGFIIAALGTLVGLSIGVWLGLGILSISNAAASLRGSLPYRTLLAIALGGSLSGIVAALVPAWRSARLAGPNGLPQR